MKNTVLLSALTALLFSLTAFAQKTTITATNYDISDNLDLRAVVSIFGDSHDLADFEYRLNHPDNQISNLDLNGDRQVDYLRVVESVDGSVRLVIIQAVLDRDLYQDIATIEAERRGQSVTLQVVGNAYLYGPNYIYEPAYVHVPVFYSHWWSIGYHPYHSPWYWGYYPTYYRTWSPFPVFAYRTHIHHHINVHHHYHYVNVRRSRSAIAMHHTHRANGYETRHPNRSFQQRNASISNRYALDQQRAITSAPVTGRNSAVVSRNNNSISSGRNSAIQNVSARTQTQSAARETNPTRTQRNATIQRAEQGNRSSASVQSRTAVSSSRTNTTASASTSRNVSPSTSVRSSSAPTQQRSAQPTAIQRTASRSAANTPSRVSQATSSSASRNVQAPRSTQRQSSATQGMRTRS